MGLHDFHGSYCEPNFFSRSDHVIKLGLAGHVGFHASSEDNAATYLKYKVFRAYLISRRSLEGLHDLHGISGNN